VDPATPGQSQPAGEPRVTPITPVPPGEIPQPPGEIPQTPGSGPPDAPGALPGDRRRPPNPIVALIVAAVAIVVVAVVLFVPQGRETIVGGSPLLDKPAPEIDLATLDGERVRLSDYRGRPVIVNFWATWCIPCREEFPLLVAAYAAHRDEGLEILGVVHDDTVDGARRFAEDYGAEWLMLDDPEDAAWNDYLGVGVPMSFFIDADGVVRAFSLGGFTETGLASQLERILPAASPSPPAGRA
jgi:cytochrome c biogenesis protein CcmG/thiol:disulfide interchange protein DsbE